MILLVNLDMDLNQLSRIKITRDWIWVKHIWDTTHVLYKAVLKNWFKGTGGGTGDCSFFEGWSDEKLEKYNIDPDIYDHTNISTCPAVMMEGYCPQKVPFLTVIFMWDKKVDFLLSSRHDPITIGLGEPGMSTASIDNVDNVSTITSDTCTGSPRRRGPNKKKKGTTTVEGVDTMISNLMDYLKKSNSENEENRKQPTRDVDELLLENCPLTELFALIEQHQNHLKLLKDNDMLTDDKKIGIITEIEDIFEMVNSRTNRNKKQSADDSSLKSNVSKK